MRYEIQEFGRDIGKKRKMRGGIKIYPNQPQPFVYLDVNVIYNISACSKIRHSFFKAFNSSNGTLCLSTHTLSEIWLREMNGWYEPFLKFWDDIGDRFIFIDFDPFAVMKREINRERHEFDCVFDSRFTKDLFINYFLKPKNEPNLRYIFEYIYSHPRILKDQRASHRNFIKSIRRNIDNLRRKHGFAKPPKVKPGRHYTPILLQNILWSIVKDQKWVFDENDAADFYHTIVPVAWCDYVVLAKGWNEIVKKAYKKVGHYTKVYKIGELEKFMKSLETDGAMINKRHMTSKWMYAISSQTRSPFHY